MFACRSVRRWTLVAALLVALGVPLPSLAAAAANQVVLSGTVVDRDGGVAIAGATLELQSNGKTAATARTDSYGVFTFPPVAPGTYIVVAMAAGYGSVRSDPFSLSGPTQSISLVLQRVQAGGSVRTIGRVVVSSHAIGLQTTTTIQAVADPTLAQRTNKIRMAEQLGQLPQVNLIGQDSAVGDDIAVDIRGLKPSESQVLLDGHPIGPLGVYPASIGGGSGGFNMQDAPLGSIENTLVTYGSGAVGLYGVDAVGGSIDMQTLNPTQQTHGQLQYGAGSYGKQNFGAQATGTDQKIGYALSYGVTGTYGDFPGAIISQTGTRGTSWDPITLAGITYFVSGAYNLRNGMAKVRYTFSPTSSLTLTGYSATSFDDKTGNGDNDYITPEWQTFNTGPPNCTNAQGQPGVEVTVTPPNVSPAKMICVAYKAYIQGASGPAGGGAAWQALTNQDYHARFLTTLGKNSIVLDGFTDNFIQIKNRDASFLEGPLTITNPSYRTFGALISDDIATGTNDVGFGFYNQRQYTRQNEVVGQTPVSGVAVITDPTLYMRLNSFFIRDAWTPSQQIQLFLNAWEKDSNIGGWSFDPRMSVVYRPTPADVIRVTGGAASADPAPIAPSLGTIGGITPGNCAIFTPVTVPTPGELPEKATDEEISLGHRWVEDTITQFTAYDTNERNTIFEANVPIAPYLGYLNALNPNYIPDVLKHVNQECGSPNPPLTIANLFATSNLNLSKARSRGLELSQRLRVNPHLVFDGYWDAQSSVIFDAPASLLIDNPTLINGSQLQGIPLHKWGLYVDVTTNKGGELYLNYTQVDSNNELSRPSFGSADLAITQQVARNTFVNLGVSNLFNQAVDVYGRIGLGVFVAENQFGTDTSALAQGSERFGQAPASVSLSVIQRY
jgi:outer membrane receptor for ferrienterochelin and colicin